MLKKLEIKPAIKKKLLTIANSDILSISSLSSAFGCTCEKITLKNLKEKLIDFYHNNKYVTACSYCKGRGYGEGEVGAAIQTKKALPLFAQS